jgi:deazaflavin-dependent oxidoreductase (nitroreductase family)
MPPLMRKIFWFLNKFFMVPIFRLGLGGILVNPFSGYIMVLKVIGRKSGKVRFAPVNYAIHKGSIYCISGGRKTSDWYKNILATPDIEVIMPGGAIFGHVTEEDDLESRRVVIRQILKNAGFAGFFEGYNPWKISDEELQRKIADMPLLRITPQGIGNGASDPMGWVWITMLALTILLILAIILLAK